MRCGGFGINHAGHSGSPRCLGPPATLYCFAHRSSCRARGSLASLRGRRRAAAGWGQEDEVSQSVPRPGGLATIRFRTLNEITSSIVPTGTTRHPPSSGGNWNLYGHVAAIAGAAACLPQRNSLPSAHMRCRITANLRATATRARAIPRRLAMFIPQERKADHLVLRISRECAASYSAVRANSSPQAVSQAVV